jgi:ubiquinone/menaquinone biosynthesis C-methylase UbiE
MSSAKPANYIPEVRAQYEGFPYPERVPGDEKKRLLTGALARLDAVSHHCYAGAQEFRGFRVLVAGGGTGDALIQWAEQLRDREGEVVYLDMSAASEKIARKRAEIRGLTNVKWISDSLLNLPELGLEPFDFIDCTGVLHHLKDPDAGLKALVSVLKPGGAMNLMVYGRYGRTGVYQMQELMRLFNAPEDSARRRIVNTKEMLKWLPQHHWLNVTRALGYQFTDMTNDSGIHDLFLHAQDRAYTIGEIHDWLERCGLEMTSEPGSFYFQTEYLPETYIRDKALLKRVEDYPLRRRQEIGEALSTKIPMHEFYAVRKGEGDRSAQTTQENLVPWEGVSPLIPLAELAPVAAQQKENFAITFEKMPGQPKLALTVGKYVPDFLRLIDGKRSIGEIIAAVTGDARFKHPPGHAEVAAEFHELFLSLNRGHACYLRDPSIAAFPSINEMQARAGK